MREMRKKKGLLFFVFFFFFALFVTPSSCSDSDSVTTHHRYSQPNENVHGPIMTRVERVKMVRERRIKGAKKDDGERRGERRRSYLKTHRKKLRSDGEEEKFVVGDDDDEDDEDVAAQRQKEIEEYINRNKDCENEDHLLGAKLPSLEQQTKRYCEKDRTTEIVCLHRKMQYPETHCMASNVKIDARMFRQWISSGKDESKYYPKEIVSKGILGGNCGRDPAFVSAQFGKGGQEILMNAFRDDRSSDCSLRGDTKKFLGTVFIIAHSYGGGNPWHELEEILHIYASMRIHGLEKTLKRNGFVVLFDGINLGDWKKTHPIYHPLVDSWFGGREAKTMKEVLGDSDCATFEKVAFIPHGGTSQLSRGSGDAGAKNCRISPVVHGFAKTILSAHPEIEKIRAEKIVFIHRGKGTSTSRPVHGYAEFINQLRLNMQRNVQVVDFAELKDIFEQMKVARGAKVLIGEHGAALTHGIWMHPGTTLVEIRQKFRCHCYENVAAWTGLKYNRLESVGTALATSLQSYAKGRRR